MLDIDNENPLVLAMARAMFINRLHLLRLTEVVRLSIRPNEEGALLLPDKLDQEMKQQAWDFVIAMLPQEFHSQIMMQHKSWMQLQ